MNWDQGGKNGERALPGPGYQEEVAEQLEENCCCCHLLDTAGLLNPAKTWSNGTVSISKEEGTEAQVPQLGSGRAHLD